MRSSAATIHILVLFNPHGLTSSLEVAGVFKVMPVVSSAHGPPVPCEEVSNAGCSGRIGFDSRKYLPKGIQPGPISKCVIYISTLDILGFQCAGDSSDYLRLHFRSWWRR